MTTIWCIQLWYLCICDTLYLHLYLYLWYICICICTNCSVHWNALKMIHTIVAFSRCICIFIFVSNFTVCSTTGGWTTLQCIQFDAFSIVKRDIPVSAFVLRLVIWIYFLLHNHLGEPIIWRLAKWAQETRPDKTRGSKQVENKL